MSTILTDAPAAADPAVASAAAAANGVGTQEHKGPTVGTPNGSTNTARWEVPEDYRAQEAVRKFMDDKHTLDPSVLLKSHVELEKKFGGDKLVIPKADAAPDAWNEVYDKLGRPAAPDGYTYKPPADLPEGVTHNADAEKFWRAAAHQNGLSDKQFNSMAKVFLDGQAQSVAGWQKAATEAKEAVTGDLKREWGQAYDQNVSTAKLAMKEYADADFIKHLDESGLGNDPRLVRVFAKIGAELMGDAKLKGANGAADGKMTPAQAQEAIRAYREANHAVLFNGEHVDHKAKVAELERLHRAAAGVA